MKSNFNISIGPISFKSPVFDLDGNQISSKEMQVGQQVYFINLEGDGRFRTVANVTGNVVTLDDGDGHRHEAVQI